MSRIPLYIKGLATATLIVLLVKMFAVTSCSIPSTGMENALYQGEKVLVNKWSYGWRIPFTASHFLPEKVRRGDVVLFNNPIQHQGISRHSHTSADVKATGKNRSFLIHGNRVIE